VERIGEGGSPVVHEGLRPSEGCLFIERTQGRGGLELLYFWGGKAMRSQD
jgi:hypothetical protein